MSYKTHLVKPGNITVCGDYFVATGTFYTKSVTCGNCKRTKAYKAERLKQESWYRIELEIEKQFKDSVDQ